MLSALGLLGLIGAASAQSMRVTGGYDCYIDGNGCVTDGNGNYGNYESCTVTFLVSGTLTSSYPFRTENYYDRWTINGNGNSYSGTNGPNNVAVSSGESMSWESNYGNTYSGYTICLSGVATTAAGSGGLFDPNSNVYGSGCDLDAAGCWTDGPGQYSSSERCSICTQRSGYISAVGDFETEGGNYDYLTMPDGTRYGLSIG